MTTRAVVAVAACALPALVAGCGQPPTATLARPPAYEPANQTKASLASHTLRPLIIDWSGHDIALLESQSKAGLVVVKYSPDKAQMELVTHCRVDGSYGYNGTTLQHEQVRARDRSELQAHFAIGVGRLEALLAQDGLLTVSTSIVGLRGTDKTITRADLRGEDCDRATHLVARISVGAFRIMTRAAVNAGAGADIALVGGGGANGQSSRETDATGGNEKDCSSAAPTDASPPNGCGSPLRLDLSEILDARPLARTCAGDTTWNGSTCVPRVTTAGRPASGSVPHEALPSAMIRIPAGTFVMGDANGDGMEQPPHGVTVASFEIDPMEVTANDYRACVDAERCAPPLAAISARCNWTQKDRLTHPINCIRWEQARDYCKFVGKRLPTEAEWEYAARGSDGRPFPWGATDPGQRICWSGRDGTCEVGTYPNGRSSFGVHDMAGNVSEWTSDKACEYDGTRCQEAHIYRGGSWSSSEVRDIRSTARRYRGPIPRDDVGVRCARDMQ